NVVFNEKDVHATDGTVTISSAVQSEGEKEKVIQHPENATQNHEKDPVNDEQAEEQKSEDEINPSTSNTIPFPASEPESETKPDDENQKQYGHGKRVAPKPQGVYKMMS